jgi:hypothetical protein
VHEADQPEAAGDLFDAHLLAGEHGTQVALAVVEADSAAAGHDMAVVVERVVEFLEPAVRSG